MSIIKIGGIVKRASEHDEISKIANFENAVAKARDFVKV